MSMGNMIARLCADYSALCYRSKGLDIKADYRDSCSCKPRTLRKLRILTAKHCGTRVLSFIRLQTLAIGRYRVAQVSGGDDVVIPQEGKQALLGQGADGLVAVAGISPVD